MYCQVAPRYVVAWRSWSGSCTEDTGISHLDRGSSKKWVFGERVGAEAEWKVGGRSVVAAAPFIDLFHLMVPRCSGRAGPETNVVGALNM